MLPGPAVTSRRLPGPAIAAAVLGVLSAAVPALALLVVLALTGGDLDPRGWLSLTVPLALIAGLVVGAVLLLRGRSWLALLVPAVVLTVLVLAGIGFGGWRGGPFGALSVAVPLGAAVLTGLPATRSWVAARRRARGIG